MDIETCILVALLMLASKFHKRVYGVKTCIFCKCPWYDLKCCCEFLYCELFSACEGCCIFFESECEFHFRGPAASYKCPVFKDYCHNFECIVKCALKGSHNMFGAAS